VKATAAAAQMEEVVGPLEDEVVAASEPVCIGAHLLERSADAPVMETREHATGALFSLERAGRGAAVARPPRRRILPRAP
jgi:hypothetical protein